MHLSAWGTQIIAQVNAGQGIRKGFPGVLEVKNMPANAGDIRGSLIPGLRRSLGEGNGNPLQYSCLENSMDRGVWWATVRRFAELEMTEAT